MAAVNLQNLVGGVAVARGDLAQILARHAIEAIDASVVAAGNRQQFIERRPVVSPVEFKADALAKFSLVNLASQPLIDDMLIARKNGLHSQHQRARAKNRVGD